MTAQSAGPGDTRPSPDEREDAEAAAAQAEYRQWSAAGRPGAISHEQARQLLLRHDA